MYQFKKNIDPNHVNAFNEIWHAFKAAFGCHDQRKTIMKNINELNLHELNLLAKLITVLTPKHLVELMNGAQIHIEDGGALYRYWKTFSGLTNRNKKSSHKSVDDQYSFQGTLVKEALFGTRIENNIKSTWIQLESHATSLSQLPGHITSFISYRVTGKNIGPYGKSHFVDNNPLRIQTNTPEPDITPPHLSIV